MASEITTDVKTIIEASVKEIPARQALYALVRELPFNERRDAAKALVAVRVFNANRATH